MDTLDYKAVFEQSSALLMVIDTNFIITAASDEFLKATKTERKNITGKNLFDVFPGNRGELNENGVGNIQASLTRVLTNKMADSLPVTKYDIPKQGTISGEFETKYWKPVHAPVFDESNNVKYIIQQAEDVTEKELLKAKLDEAQSMLFQLEESNPHYQRMLMQSQFGFSVFRGKEMVVALANDLIKNFWGKGNEVEGKKLLEILPELKDQIFPAILDNVYKTGIPFFANEILASINHNGISEDHFFNVVYHPHYEKDESILGVATVVYEVTELVMARKKMEESEQRLRILVEKSPVPICILKGETMLLEVANDPVFKIWNIGKEALGKAFLEIKPEMKTQPFMGWLLDVYHSGVTHYGNEEPAFFFRDNGETEKYFFDFIYQPFHENDGSISGVMILATDVTQQVIARKKIEESELHFRLMADLMPAKISYADSDGKLVYFNRHWLDFAGLDFNEFSDFGYYKLIHPDDLAEFKKRFKNACETRTELAMEMRFLNRNGAYKWHLNLASPVLDEKGSIKMWIGSTTEIHEQIVYKVALEHAVTERTQQLKTANEALVLQNDLKEKRAVELLIVNKELEAFTFVSSHDLQEPLRKIQTFASFILEKDLQNLSESGKDNFKRIQTAAKNMQQLIQDLIAFSRLNKAERKFENTDLRTIVAEVIYELKEVIEEKHAIIDATTFCEAKIIVFQFHQLMHNLMSNALKFSTPGIAPHIVIKSSIKNGSQTKVKTLDPEKNYCHISFQDNGIGFDPIYSEIIFTVFQRLHSKEVYPGTGIGLTIVKKIVENHDGIIFANSTLGNGATFDIYIPAL